VPEYYTTHSVVAELKDGRVMAKATYAQVLAAQTNNIVVRVPDLREIETIIQVEFYTNPDTSFTSFAYMDKKITGNVVGMTLYGLAAGTTLTTEVVAIGPP